MPNSELKHEIILFIAGKNGFERKNPTAAKNVTSKILKSAGLLGEQPRLCFSVADKTGRETDVLCMFSGNYGVFYKITPKGILVVRILDARTDYMKYVFAEEKEPEANSRTKE